MDGYCLVEQLRAQFEGHDKLKDPDVQSTIQSLFDQIQQQVDPGGPCRAVGRSGSLRSRRSSAIPGEHSLAVAYDNYVNHHFDAIKQEP